MIASGNIVLVIGVLFIILSGLVPTILGIKYADSILAFVGFAIMLTGCAFIPN